MAIELIWATDRLSLYNELECKDEDITLPTRNMLWLIINDIIKQGKVYVDCWPYFQHVCTLHSITLYEPKCDGDFATLASVEENSDTLSNFLNNLANERHWRTRDMVVFDYVTEFIAKLAESVLCGGGYGNAVISRTWRVFTNCEADNLLEYEKRLPVLLEKIESQFIVDQVQPHEGAQLAKHWMFDTPFKEVRFSWQVSILPSICIRDAGTGRPVAWNITYNVGSRGAIYVLPEYRGKGLADLCALLLSLKLAKVFPTKKGFCSMADESLKMMKISDKIYFDKRRTDFLECSLVYYGKKSTTQAKL